MPQTGALIYSIQSNIQFDILLSFGGDYFVSPMNVHGASIVELSSKVKRSPVISPHSYKSIRPSYAHFVPSTKSQIVPGPKEESITDDTNIYLLPSNIIKRAMRCSNNIDRQTQAAFTNKLPPFY